MSGAAPAAPGPARRDALVLLAAWAVAAFPAFLVRPALDDWTTARPTLTPFSWDLLRPGLFWRPFEELLLLAAGIEPSALHPHLAHGVAVLGHGLAMALVLLLARRIAAGALPLAAAALFGLSPACAAAAWSVDSAIQTWSTALGLCATWVLVAGRTPAVRAAWLLPALGAALWKESGVGWLVAAPVAAELLRARPDGDGVRAGLRRALPAVAAGLVAFALYLAARTALAAGGALGLESGRYALHLSAATWARNAAMLLGVAGTTTDTVALFGDPARPALAAASALAGLPLLAVLAAAARRLGPRRGLAALGLVGAVLGPHLPMGHVSEMYAHPVAAALALVGAAALGAGAAPPGRLARAAAALFLAASLAVGAHKAASMVATGRGAAAVGDAIADAWGEPPPASLCAVRDPAAAARGYSVFQAPPAKASAWGRAATARWGWALPADYEVRDSVEACAEAATEGTVTFAPDGTPAVRRR